MVVIGILCGVAMEEVIEAVPAFGNYPAVTGVV